MIAPYAHVVLKELPLDAGLTKTDIADMADMLETDEFLFLEIENPNATSYAVGFITFVTADRLHFDYTAVQTAVQPILADTALESPNGFYHIPDKDITIFLTR